MVTLLIALLITTHEPPSIPCKEPGSFKGLRPERPGFEERIPEGVGCLWTLVLKKLFGCRPL